MWRLVVSIHLSIHLFVDLFICLSIFTIHISYSVDDFNKNYIQKYEYVATFHDGETGNLGGFVFSDPIIRNKRAKDGMKYTFIQVNVVMVSHIIR